MFSWIHRTVRIGSLALALLAASFLGRANASGEEVSSSVKPLQVLILSGHGDPNWRVTTPVIRQILADTRRFDVRICETAAGLSPQTLADFDVLIADHANIPPGSETEGAITKFVEAGKGLVLTQSALASFVERPASEGGKTRVESNDGKASPGIWPISLSPSTLSPVHFFTVKVAKDEHPIVQGIKRESKVADAYLQGLTILPGTEVLATALDTTKAGENGKEEPVLLAARVGKGRVFATALGHDLSGMHEDTFITTLARGTEWAATGSVTLPSQLTVPQPLAGAVKGLLITGGHDHETAFYSLFEGHNDLNWLPLATSTTAFQKDLRGKYDVIIMYDFSRDLDDTGKKNLRDFVEAGGGIVVLHHALLNYQKWNWWYQDTVGGSYRLSREGNVPSSTVKDREQIYVTPAGNHPITKGIKPFHIVDETYGRMWISPQVHPLLTTDNPNSTHELAWVGPNDKLKVVAIQLGHGHTAFGHPSYRALVHNAILWASGRIK